MKIEALLGGRKLLSTNTYLIPQSEELKVSLEITPQDISGVTENIKMAMSIVFEDDSSEEQNVVFKVGPDQRMTMFIKNWGNPLGTTLNAMYPIIAFESNQTIDMMIHNVRISETNILTLQFWTKGSE
ncbi:hypothetical protein [Serratia sp. P2ACOL2]|uniref:hypothetical protein n=1 Tax=Serratia sp. P2ACOL2 TaxID=2482769 RepID=UPI000EFD095D|nr:hypothetical protein [Serratia sp. P2ACOL2]AYO37654.1 hypothetical protein EBA31_10265 [Serratia sp. P2ACOL2]